MNRRIASSLILILMTPKYILILPLLLALFSCNPQPTNPNMDYIDFDMEGYKAQRDSLKTKIEYHIIDGKESKVPSQIYSYFLFRGREYNHGDYTAFFQDSLIREKGYYEDGSIEGEYITYHKNGELSTIGHYREGKLHGPYKSFYDTGAKFEEINFADDQLDGEALVYFQYGTLKRKAIYQAGKLWNLIVINDSTGAPLVENSLIEGNGIDYAYDDKGQKLLEIPMKDGEAHGLTISYNPAGWIESKVPFEQDKKHGEMLLFHENGQVAKKIQWFQDIVIDLKQYNEAGTLIWEVPYKGPPFTYADSVKLNLFDHGPISDLFDALLSTDGTKGIKDGCVKHYFEDGKIKEIICYTEGIVDSLRKE